MYEDDVAPPDRRDALYGPTYRRPRPALADLPLPPEARALAPVGAGELEARHAHALELARRALAEARSGHVDASSRTLEHAVHQGTRPHELLLAAYELGQREPAGS